MPSFCDSFYNFVPVMIKTQMEMYLHEELETLTRTEIERCNSSVCSVRSVVV